MTLLNNLDDTLSDMYYFSDFLEEILLTNFQEGVMGLYERDHGEST